MLCSCAWPRPSDGNKAGGAAAGGAAAGGAAADGAAAGGAAADGASSPSTSRVFNSRIRDPETDTIDRIAPSSLPVQLCCHSRVDIDLK